MKKEKGEGECNRNQMEAFDHILNMWFWENVEILMLQCDHRNTNISDKNVRGWPRHLSIVNR